MNWEDTEMTDKAQIRSMVMNLQRSYSKIGLRDLALSAVIVTLAFPFLLAAAMPAHLPVVAALGVAAPFFSMTLVEDALGRQSE
jgi:hypothetical protein